jgi:hypothetical protein
LDEKKTDSEVISTVRMESSMFPGKDLIQLIEERMKKLLKEPTRTKFRSSEAKSMETNRLIPFSSAVPVPIEGVNFGKPGGPVVYPKTGNILDMEVVSYSPFQPGILIVVPYQSVRDNPLHRYSHDINSYYSHAWVKPSDPCECLKDGHYFGIKTKSGYERCRVISREYGSAFKFTPENKTLIKTVKILLLDKGEVINVRAENLRYLPPEFAVIAPAQAIMANWCRTGNWNMEHLFVS